MPIVNITAAAMDAIRSQSYGDFNPTGKQLPDGSWNTHLEADTLERLENTRLEGETLSDCIQRIIALVNGGAN